MQKLEAKLKWMEEIIGDSGFDTIGKFLQILFYNPIHISGKDDPCGTTHGLAVAQFLHGKTKVKMSKIIDLIYSHKHSAPLSRLTHYHEHHAPFSLHFSFWYPTCMSMLIHLGNKSCQKTCLSRNIQTYCLNWGFSYPHINQWLMPRGEHQSSYLGGSGKV